MLTRTAGGELHGHEYSVVTRAYADAIHVLVHKDEKVGRMFKCQLYPQPQGVPHDGLLAGVTAERLVGGSAEDISGNLYTEMIASLILKQAPDESRLLILGLGNVGPRTNEDISPTHREELLFVIKLAQESSVWN